MRKQLISLVHITLLWLNIFTRFRKLWFFYSIISIIYHRLNWIILWFITKWNCYYFKRYLPTEVACWKASIEWSHYFNNSHYTFLSFTLFKIELWQHLLTVLTDYLIQFIFHYNIYFILRHSLSHYVFFKIHTKLLSFTWHLIIYATYSLPHDGVTALVQNGLWCHFSGHAFDSSNYFYQKKYISL